MLRIILVAAYALICVAVARCASTIVHLGVPAYAQARRGALATSTGSRAISITRETRDTSHKQFTDLEGYGL